MGFPATAVRVSKICAGRGRSDQTTAPYELKRRNPLTSEWRMQFINACALLCRSGPVWNSSMLLLLSVVSAGVGAALACASDKMPLRRASLEQAGGLLLVFGLALLGAGLPIGL